MNPRENIPQTRALALPWSGRWPARPAPALRLSATAQNLIKGLALLTMLLDHANKIVFDGGEPWMTWVGRMAYPLFAFLIAYNLEVHRADWRKYAWRLGLAGLVSQPVYYYALAGNLNIFFTLLAGVLVYVAAKRLAQTGRLWFFLLIVLAMLPAYYFDYRWFGVLLIPAWAWALRENATPVLRWSAVGLSVLLMNGLLKSSLFGLLALGLVWLLSRLEFKPSLGTRSRWAALGFYAFYPLHLLALALVGGWRL